MPAPIELHVLYRNTCYGFRAIVTGLEYFDTGILVLFDSGRVELLETFYKQYERITA